jgi:hypothetical protein
VAQGAVEVEAEWHASILGQKGLEERDTGRYSGFMPHCSWFLAPALFFSASLAGGHEGTVLDYQAIVHLREGARSLETHFQVATTPPVPVRNKVKRPRYVGWKVRFRPGKGPLPPAAVLARVESLLYLEGPTDGLVPREGGTRFGKRFCRLWQVQTPPQLGAFVYLVEVAPDLLALSYLSASLPEGDVASLEIHLEGVSVAAKPAPAEEGMVLLHTLRSWGMLLDPGQQLVETEEIQ